MIAVGVALAGLILRMGSRLDGLAGRVEALADRVGALGERVARIEGLIEGWRASEGGTE